MILVVAPYSPPKRGYVSHLGASRKIELIVAVLFQIDPNIVLVNSAHNDTHPAPLKISESMVGDARLIEITLPTSANRLVGKLKNVFCVNRIIDAVKKIGDPQFIWLYNGYAFEMRFADIARQKFKVPMIIEFEDGHFSRSRGMNPKPYIDYICWRKSVKYMAGAFTANDFLASKVRDLVPYVELLPGVVPKVLRDIANDSPPFSSQEESIHVGYFGGLSVEKGADIVLRLAMSLPDEFVVHVTGAGPLAAKFEDFEKKYPRRMRYYGRVDDEILYQVIAECDVMINPHSSIENMDNGIFPFKVVEGVASGRLFISTMVPKNGLQDVLVGVQFIEHSTVAFHAALVASKQRYLQSADLIRQGARIANQRFGENALLEKVKEILKGKSN